MIKDPFLIKYSAEMVRKKTTFQKNSDAVFLPQSMFLARESGGTFPIFLENEIFFQCCTLITMPNKSQEQQHVLDCIMNWI